MTSSEVVYALFAVVHPLSELWNRTSLQAFLNRDYYHSNRDDFPVSRLFGVGGSLAVAVILLLPLQFHARWAWCLALGLAAADLVQHATHAALRPRKPAPWIHLVTIVVVLGWLPFVGERRRDEPQGWCILALLGGAAVIFGNWLRNSSRARRQVTR